ncbi:ArnT family glycosyltransferase [Polaromonas jejuensis]|uniref:ArnT family glycosyltransferase n=1 Tax=Polaromonas jejuensis TaxID=457502 RepID=A0ABW0QBA7_9BURK|nr:glycosyltransferase family 39 protein [Polaromonas jejuensis]
MTEQRKSWLTLAAIFLLLLVLATLRPLAVPDEGRYGEMGRWMLYSGDWLTPRLNGIPFFHKPPYLYWLEAVSLATLGVNAWALRLVPALHAGLMLLAMYASARRFASESIARRAVWMLGSSLSFLLGGQYVNHDMLVAAWIGVAIWCFALAFMHADRPQANLARWGFVACALGVLSKGLIGVALPGLVLLVWLLWTRQLKKVLYLPWGSGLALFAVIALPWFWFAERQFPGMLDYMFGTQQVRRFSATSFNNGQPWWFYGPCLVVLLFPWVFFAINQAVAQLKRSQAATNLIASAWRALCWIWVLAIIGFFSIPSSKIIGYALPVMPPLALLAAMGWDDAMARLRLAARARGRWFAALCLASLGIAVAANMAAADYTRKYGAQDVAQALQAAGAQASDTVYLLGDYAYDLPFYRQASTPMLVIQDWPALRKLDGDDWQHELLDGAGFDAQAARVLQAPEVLAQAGKQAGVWVVAGRDTPLDGFVRVFKGRAWSLYRPQAANGSAPEGPKPAE